MKNIIYYAFDENYLKLFKYSYYSIRKFLPEVDILCIIPKGLNIPNNFKITKFEQENFEFQYTARYTICNWDSFDEYDNYLYLDCDTIAAEGIEAFFEKIQMNPDKIHAVKENDSINQANSHFNFNKSFFEDDCPSYNSGVFGFNKSIKHKFKEFLIFIEANKKKSILSDQPLFNVFFHGLFINSYGENTELFEMYKPFQTKLIHLAGMIYDSTGKDKIYRRFLRKETRGEILNLLPDIANIGIFNCGQYFIDGPIKYQIEKKYKKINVLKDNYDVSNEYYDLIYIDSAKSANNIIEIIRILYKKVKKGGIISSVSGNETSRQVLKKFINDSKLDYFQCFEDDVFFTIKL